MSENVSAPVDILPIPKSSGNRQPDNFHCFSVLVVCLRGLNVREGRDVNVQKCPKIVRGRDGMSKKGPKSPEGPMTILPKQKVALIVTKNKDLVQGKGHREICLYFSLFCFLCLIHLRFFKASKCSRQMY